MRLRVQWSGDTVQEDTVECGRENDCIFEEFKRWAVQQFRMEESKETIKQVVIAVDGIADSSSCGVILTELEWTEHTAAAARRSPDQDILVQCIGEMDEAARRKDLQDRAQCRVLEFSTQSTEIGLKQKAIQVSRTRSHAEISVLINKSLDTRDDAERTLATQVPGTKISEADLTYPATT